MNEGAVLSRAMRLLHDSPPDTTFPVWVSRIWHTSWVWRTLIVVLFCVPLFFGLNRTDLENDEAGYSFGVERMIDSGDWMTPVAIYPGGPPFLEKPPLKFWIVALPIHWGLLPNTGFGLRFWDALMGSMAFLYVFAIGRRLAGPICGFIAVLLLFTNQALVFEHGLRTNNMEAPLVLAYAAGVYHFLAWRSSGPGDRRHVFAIALYFVLAFMTKFVAALFLPVMLAMVAFLKAEDRERLRLNWLTVVLAGLVAIALIAPWFVYQYFARGPGLFQIMFGEHVLTRFTVFLDPNHLRPWHYYLTEVWRPLQGTSAGVLVALGAVLIVVRSLRRRWIEGVLVVLWFAFPVAAISAGTSKLPHYLYPFVPPVALAGGYAAATVAALAFRWLRRSAEVFDGARARALPGFLRTPRAGAILTALGLAALAISVATSGFDRVRITVGDTMLFRNSSVMRPMVLGLAALLAGAPAVVIRTAVPAAIVLTAAPRASYPSAVSQTFITHRPVHDVRECLSAIVAQGVAEGQKPPGVWVEAPAIGHVYYYNLRNLGPWQARTVASDATVAVHLFAPSAYRPVLLSRARFAEFVKRLADDRDALMTAAARKADMTAEAMLETMPRTTIRMVDFWNEVLLLPGAYAGCGTDAFFPRDAVNR